MNAIVSQPVGGHGFNLDIWNSCSQIQEKYENIDLEKIDLETGFQIQKFIWPSCELISPRDL